MAYQVRRNPFREVPCQNCNMLTPVRNERCIHCGEPLSDTSGRAVAGGPRTAPRYRERHSEPQDGLEYVWISPGKFQMGAVPGDDEARDHEKPRHRVEITKGFWMSRTPVTVVAYKRFVEATSHKMPEAPSFNASWGKEDHPIVNVSWHEAAAYCEWADGRLPTDAEWEYAARGGKEDLIYPWGNKISSQNAKYNSTDGTAPVGSYPANGFGLHDMAGNVWEWCLDWFTTGYYASSPSRDPQGPSEKGRLRGLRGGSWFVSPVDQRSSVRYGIRPGVWVHYIGFRCAREVSP